jgi:hypothetical protein
LALKLLICLAKDGDTLPVRFTHHEDLITGIEQPSQHSKIFRQIQRRYVMSRGKHYNARVFAAGFIHLGLIDNRVPPLLSGASLPSAHSIPSGKAIPAIMLAAALDIYVG